MDSRLMAYIHEHWPFMLCAGSMYVVAVMPHLRRAKNSGRWCGWLLVAVGGIHQFEEFGVDAYGRNNAAFASLNRVACSSLSAWFRCEEDMAKVVAAGAAKIQQQQQPHQHHINPISQEAVTWMNVGFQLWFVSSAVFAQRKRHFPIASLASFILVNALFHLCDTICQRSYTPGLLTAAVGLFPFGVFVLTELKAEGTTNIALVFSALLAAAQHAGLFWVFYVQQFGYLGTEDRAKAAIVLILLFPLLITWLAAPWRSGGSAPTASGGGSRHQHHHSSPSSSSFASTSSLRSNNTGGGGGGGISSTTTATRPKIN